MERVRQGYEPFGSLLPGRNYSSDAYRFGFQGQEMDDEMHGSTGTSYAYKYRMHDPRIGRFLSIDPLSAKYPFYSPYAFSGNRVIDMVELEGLEPAEPGTAEGQYSGAPKSGTEDNFGWTWTKGSWAQSGSTDYSIGNAAANSPDDDLTKTHHPGVAVNSLCPDNLQTCHDLNFRNSFMMGTGLEHGRGWNEKMALINGFRSGNGGPAGPFESNSFMATLLRQDGAFVNIANTFEAAALAHFRQNGTMDGFVGSAVLQAIGLPYIDDTFFMHTVMGGTQQFDAKIQSVSATDVVVQYRVWDHFGAGTSDAASSLPGLASMYWLQHNSALDNPGEANRFVPFVWSILLNR